MSPSVDCTLLNIQQEIHELPSKSPLPFLNPKEEVHYHGHIGRQGKAKHSPDIFEVISDVLSYLATNINNIAPIVVKIYSITFIFSMLKETVKTLEEQF